jgi:hypothetical protein
MGGGGGGESIAPKDAASRIRESESETVSAGFESQLASYLQELLSKYNTRDTQLVNKRLGEILEVLAEDLEGSLEALFGGSVAKHTYVDGLSDIDSLLVVNKSELANSSPEDVQAYIARKLSDAFQGQAEMEAGRLAVTMKYPDGMEIQLLPALRTLTGVKIASARRKDWSELVRPKKFAEVLSKTNAQCNGKLIPTIKLAKALNDVLPSKQQLSGYHIESMAIQAFKEYTGTKTTGSMLPRFFERMATLVLKPMTDRTGQSRHVDDYLGAGNSGERQKAAHLLNRIVKRMRNATGAASLTQWKTLFEE